MKTSILLLLASCVWLLWPYSLLAQSIPSTSPIHSQPIPPSPEAAALGKFGDIPVGLHTGVPKISVPIHTIKLKDLELPISVDYHASGIRVEEVASSVGLGWGLNAGGSISSTVNGSPDLGANGFALGSHVDFLNFNPNSGDEDIDYVYAKDVCEGDIDSQPDVYHFNFLGRFGKFTFDAQKNIHPIPYQKIKITADPYNIPDHPFTIQDEQGNKYYFEAIEYMEVGSVGPYCADTRRVHNLVHYLTRVETAQGESVTINYRSVTYSYQHSRSRTDYVRNPSIQHDCTRPPTAADCINTAQVGARLISSIESSDGTKVSFKYSDEIPIQHAGVSETERRDLPGTYALRRITIKYGDDEASVKEFSLSYDYAVSPGAPSVYTASSANYYRLLLTAVEETGKPKYSFFYNQSIPMYSRLSGADDAWGYFNPNFSGAMPKVILPGIGEIPGKDMAVDSSYTQSLILDSLVYPTGGATRFKYQANWYNKTSNATEQVLEHEVKGVSSYDGTLQNTFDVSTEAFNAKLTMYSECTGSTQIGSNCVFVLTENNTNNVRNFTQSTDLPFLPSGGNYTLTIENEDCDCSGSVSWDILKTVPIAKEKKFIVGGVRIAKITNYPGLGGPPVIKRYAYNVPNESTSSGYVLYEPLYTYDISMPTRGSLENGWYDVCTYTARTTSSVLPLSGVQGSSIGYRYVTEIFGENGESGISVNEFKEVSDIGGNTSIPMTPITSYDWLRGLLVHKADYRYDVSDPLSPYKLVKEIRNEYEIKHNNVSFYGFLYSPFPNETNVIGVKIRIRSPEWQSGFIKVSATFDIERFKNVSAWFYLKRKTEILYGVSGTEDVLWNETEYSYDNPSHVQLTKETTISSDGSSLIREYAYPADYIEPVPSPIAQMRGERHMHGKVIETTTRKRSDNESKVTGSTFFEYDFVGNDDPNTVNDDRFVLPVKVKNAELISSTTSFESSLASGTAADENYSEVLRVTYDPRSANQVEVKKADNAPVVYLWSYNHAYPVIEVKNSSYAEVVSALGGIAFVNDLAASDRPTQTQQSALNNLRAQLADAMVTVFTYSPLIGIDSITDPNGRTTYYEYDGLGRLQAVKDDAGNVLKAYEYHYQGQE